MTLKKAIFWRPSPWKRSRKTDFPGQNEKHSGISVCHNRIQKGTQPTKLRPYPFSLFHFFSQPDSIISSISVKNGSSDSVSLSIRSAITGTSSSPVERFSCFREVLLCFVFRIILSLRITPPEIVNSNLKKGRERGKKSVNPVPLHRYTARNIFPSGRAVHRDCPAQ